VKNSEGAEAGGIDTAMSKRNSAVAVDCEDIVLTLTADKRRTDIQIIEENVDEEEKAANDISLS